MTTTSQLKTEQLLATCATELANLERVIVTLGTTIDKNRGSGSRPGRRGDEPPPPGPQTQ
jgi:hypothetical protein